MNGFIIAGTDTDVGKTVFAAALMPALKAAYWKPVQCGLEQGGDGAAMQVLTGLPEADFLPERYVLKNPLSPHRAAELDGLEISIESLKPPTCGKPLLIEAAGGLLVPMTRNVLQIDVFKIWARPVILCARTGLGTINHTLLSMEALRHRGLPVQGIAFIGEENEDNMRTIAAYSGIKILGRLPRLAELNEDNLNKAFAENFDLADFETRMVA